MKNSYWKVTNFKAAWNWQNLLLGQKQKNASHIENELDQYIDALFLKNQEADFTMQKIAKSRLQIQLPKLTKQRDLLMH